eukprot:321826_1
MNKQSEIAQYLKNNYQVDGKKPDDVIIDTTTTKILLLGTGSSGKSTIFKQFKLYGGIALENEDKLQFKCIIEENIISNILWILKAINNKKVSTTDDNEIKFDGYSENALNVMSIFEALEFPYELTVNIANAIKIVWAENDIQQMYELRHQYGFKENLNLFINDIDRIVDSNYIPTEKDVLLSYSLTVGITTETFKINETRFAIVDTGGQRTERRKWISCYDEVFCLIFVVDISGYNKVLMEDNTQNRMSDSLQCFQHVVNEKALRKSQVVLFFNQIDAFKENYKKYPINVHCEEFKDYDSEDDNYEQTISFIQRKFNQTCNDKNKTIYTHLTCAIDTDYMTNIFGDVFNVITAERTKHVASFKSGLW